MKQTTMLLLGPDKSLLSTRELLKPTRQVFKSHRVPSEKMTKIVQEGSAEVDAKHIHKKQSQHFPLFPVGQNHLALRSSSMVMFAF